MRPKIVYIAYRFPLLTQTFIQREIAGVASHGFDIEILSLRATPPVEHFVPAPNTRIVTFQWKELAWLPWRFLTEICRDPLLLFQGIKLLRENPFVSRDNLWINLLGAAVAFCRAHEYRKNPPAHFHGTWATGPATAAGLLGRMTKKPFSFGGHAFDIYRHGGDTFLNLKLSKAKFIHTTTAANVRYLQQRMKPHQTPILLARRGLEEMPEPTSRELFKHTLQILAVARLVEKKGLHHQIQAAAQLKNAGISFHWTIVGEGPMRSALQAAIQQFSLENHVTLTGAKPHEEVKRYYLNTDIFVHTGLVDQEGDRDGLPNVLPEAMARRLVVVSSPTEGADEAIQEGETGWVADPLKPGEISRVIMKILKEQPEALRRAEIAREWVKRNFLAVNNTALLAKAFQ